eukprot:scaffold66076_cov31-Attheya_sp.AAC.5
MDMGHPDILCVMAISNRTKVGRKLVDEDGLGLDDGKLTIESDQIHKDNMEDVGSPTKKKATQKDLESAIQAGDWVVVGTTAAVLAALPWHPGRRLRNNRRR